LAALRPRQRDLLAGKVAGNSYHELVKREGSSYVEHDDVVRVVRHNPLEIAGVDGLGPPLDGGLDLLVVVH
jgi:hypothetical protein